MASKDMEISDHNYELTAIDQLPADSLKDDGLHSLFLLLYFSFLSPSPGISSLAGPFSLQRAFSPNSLPSLCPMLAAAAGHMPPSTSLYFLPFVLFSL